MVPKTRRAATVAAVTDSRCIRQATFAEGDQGLEKFAGQGDEGVTWRVSDAQDIGHKGVFGWISHNRRSSHRGQIDGGNEQQEQAKGFRVK